MKQQDIDLYYMAIALKQAKKAFLSDEVPVGAVLVLNDKIVSMAHNKCVAKADFTAHAELLCIQKACRSLGFSNLSGAKLYVTLEPCLMCTGAIINSKISEVIFALKSKDNGSLFSNFNPLIINGCYNNQLTSRVGPLGKESEQLLCEFFKKHRNS